MAPLSAQRLAGVNLPLSALRSASDWGVGELPDLARFAPVFERAGLRLITLLPLLEPTPGQESPYSPVSAFAIDPLYVSLDAVPDFVALGGRSALADDDRARLAAARASTPVAPAIVRPLKERWLRRAFARFEAAEGPDSERRAAFDRFRDRAGGWLDDYTLFRALKRTLGRSWREWPEDLRAKDPAAVATARAAHADEIRFRAYVQWLAFEQLAAVRYDLGARGVALGGDEPFLTAEDSADVWGAQRFYRFDCTVGAPPDAFSETGQDWGLPPYRWEAIRAEDYRLFEARGRHAAQLFDIVRVDHVVGLFRTYHRPLDETVKPFFVPDEVPDQIAQGEAVLRAFAAGGVELMAEDLGVVPDFVRASMADLEVPGFRVIRWEIRDGVLDPATWPRLSVATTGTHDTETLATWWEAAPQDRPPFFGLPAFADVPEDARLGFTPAVHEALLRATLESPSNLAVLAVQDLFGLYDRINTPNTVGPHNWSWRLPWSLETLEAEAHVAAALARVGDLCRMTGRA